MTWFTNNLFEKKITQKPNGRSDTAFPVPVSLAYDSYSCKGLNPCVGYCIKKLQGKQKNPPLFTGGGQLMGISISHYRMEALVCQNIERAFL